MNRTVRVILLLMQTNATTSGPPPSRGATITVAGMGTIYLAIGACMLWAYSTTFNNLTGYGIRWARLPVTTLLLLPGTALLLAAFFVRKSFWAVSLAATVLGLSIPPAGWMLVKSLIALRVIPVKGTIVLVFLAMWLASVGLGLMQLRGQWRFLRIRASPAGTGFPIE